MTIQEKLKTFFAQTGQRERLTVLIVLAAVGGFVAYSRYSHNQPQLNEDVQVQTSRENIGSISGGAIGPEEKSGTVAGVSTDITKKAENAQVGVKTDWVARPIDRNSIKDNSYTVQSGDTLWQIAQGKYGSGFEWKKVLEANKDKVGFLPDGSQALIEVGQTLSLP